MKVKESTLILYGSAKDPELQESINRAAITGRKVVVKPTPPFKTNKGKLYHCCQGACALNTNA
ncbi:MAG: hypothetical protein O9340_04290 [Cyclobacteriaceae bacterium]|jgi:hypothetical protein|nr:hypothetical protein [Cyclobacteriaceae bacterium]